MDLPHDRMTVERFREAFPRARWSERRKAWFVPGRTAEKRISRWLAEIEAEAEAFADDKGRDAFAFDPIESRYLKAGTAALLIRTPYPKRSSPKSARSVTPARTLIDVCGACLTGHTSISGTDGRLSKASPLEVSRRQERSDEKRSVELKKTRLPRRGAGSEAASAIRFPPIRYRSCPGNFHPYRRYRLCRSGRGIADAETVHAFYFPPDAGRDYVWVAWRTGKLEELVTAWPAPSGSTAEERHRGWYLPTLDELRVARRDARSRENLANVN